MIRYNHEDQVPAKVMLEQKADFFKIRLKLVNARTRTIQNQSTEIKRRNALVN